MSETRNSNTTAFYATVVFKTAFEQYLSIRGRMNKLAGPSSAHMKPLAREVGRIVVVQQYNSLLELVKRPVTA